MDNLHGLHNQLNVFCAWFQSSNVFKCFLVWFWTFLWWTLSSCGRNCCTKTRPPTDTLTRHLPVALWTAASKTVCGMRQKCFSYCWLTSLNENAFKRFVLSFKTSTVNLPSAVTLSELMMENKNYEEHQMEHSLMCSRALDIVFSWLEEAWDLWNVDFEKNGAS